MKLLLWIFQFAFGGCHHSPAEPRVTIERRKKYQFVSNVDRHLTTLESSMRPVASSFAGGAYAPLKTTNNNPDFFYRRRRILNSSQVSYLAQTRKSTSVIL